MATALREVLAKFGFEIENSDKLKKANKDTDKLADSLKNVGKMLAGAVVFNGIKNFITGMQAAGDAVNTTSARLGISTQEWQRWAAAGELAGASAEDMASALKDVQKNAVAATKGGADQAMAFRRFGVSIRDANGKIRESPELLRETLIGMSRIQDPARRAAMATALLGGAAVKLAPMAEGGAAGVDKLLGSIDELGGGYSKEALKTIAEMQTATVRFRLSLTSLKSKIAVELFPTLNQWMEKGSKLISWFGKATADTNTLKASIVVLGVAAAASGWAAVKPWAPLLLALAAAVLLVDDLITFFEGGESLLGDFFKGVLGEDTFKIMQEDLADFWKELEKAPTLLGKFETAFGIVGARIVKFWIDDIPEALTVALKTLDGTLYEFDENGDRVFEGRSAKMKRWMREQDNKIRDFLSMSEGEFAKWHAEITMASTKWVVDLFMTIARYMVAGFVRSIEQQKALFTRFFTWLKGWTVDVGKMILDGLVDGIVSAFDRVTGVFSRLAKAMAKKFKKFFKIDDDAPDASDASGAQNVLDTFAGFAGLDMPSGAGPWGAPALRIPGAGGNVNANVNQTNHNTINIAGGGRDSQDIADDVRDGMLSVFGDDRDAMLNALEVVVP